MLGVGVLGAGSYLLVAWIMPAVGLNLLDLARSVEAADLPGTVLRWWMQG